MARLLIKGEWYEKVAPTALYEGEFETIFLQHVEKVFPEFVVAPFKCLVTSEYGVHKPDLALIDRRYRSWWVIEVELAHHALSSHVLPQVRVFATGEYGDPHAKYLCDQSTELDPSRVRDMLRGQPPQVLVVVNAPCPDWVPILRPYGALVTVFEVFRSRLDRQVYRVAGEHPDLPTDVLTECEFDRSLPKFLKVLSPAVLPCNDGETVHLTYDGSLTVWKRVDAEDSVWLIPAGPNPLSTHGRYQIIRDESGRLGIRSSGFERR